MQGQLVVLQECSNHVVETRNYQNQLFEKSKLSKSMKFHKKIKLQTSEFDYSAKIKHPTPQIIDQQYYITSHT